MPRKKGSTNTDFDATKQTLLARIRTAMFGDEPPSSFRSLAKAAKVTIPTLRHYFGDREEVIAAVFADCHLGGREQLEVAETPTGPFRQSILALVEHVAGGFRFGGLAQLHGVGLIEGLGEQRVARAYLADVLEPTIQAVQKRLEVHIDRGEMKPTNARHAAVGLISPILIVFLHQQGLHGSDEYPIDITAFLADHSKAFLAAYELSGQPYG